MGLKVFVVGGLMLGITMVGMAIPALVTGIVLIVGAVMVLVGY